MGRPVPNFWWNFVGENLDIIVQSDYPGGEALALFKAAPDEISRDPQISQAEKLICDFKAGRKTPQWGTKETAK